MNPEQFEHLSEEDKKKMGIKSEPEEDESLVAEVVQEGASDLVDEGVEELIEKASGS